QAFRQDVRRYETDEGKFRICAEARSRLLEQHTQVKLLIALYERVMLAECPGYRSCKKNAGRTQIDANDEWDRFIGVATSASDMIPKCLPHLKIVSVRWGRKTLQHYNWPARGWGFCKNLGAIAKKMAWAEFITKANQLLVRRAQMSGKHRLRESPDPLDPVELVNLGRWTAQGSYVKDKDRNKIALPFKELSLRDLPLGYSFDRYGLMVHRRFGEKIWDAVLTPEQDAGQSNSVQLPVDSRAPSPRHSQLSIPLNSPPDSPSAVDRSCTAQALLRWSLAMMVTPTAVFPKVNRFYAPKETAGHQPSTLQFPVIKPYSNKANNQYAHNNPCHNADKQSYPAPANNPLLYLDR
ncbi:hypothetical protein QBC38DRAFT_520115, partial [Podospora fimiseda]